MIASLYLHIIFLSPSLLIAGVYVLTFGILLAIMALSILKPQHEFFVFGMLQAPHNSGTAFFAAYLILWREVKRYLTDRKSSLKWQQMVKILESQSDAIVAIKTSDQFEHKNNNEEDNKLTILFNNDKSKELFKFDLQNDNLADNLSDHGYIYIKDEQADDNSNFSKPLNPRSYAKMVYEK